MNLCLKCFIKICISEHIVIHVVANRQRTCRALMVKAIEVMQVRYEPYATIEKEDFSNDLVLDNLV